MRRLLEVICLDRVAKEGTLASMLADFVSIRDIPAKSIDVAKGLKDLGYHATIGELIENEIPILAALTNAILDYVYNTPYVVDVVEKKIL